MKTCKRCARWFEVLVPRPCVARAIELIAATGAAELDAQAELAAEGVELPDVQDDLGEFRRLEQAFGPYWPAPRMPEAASDRHIERVLGEALERLRAWESEALPQVRRLEERARDREGLSDLRAFLVAMQGDETLDYGALVSVQPPAASRLFVLAPETPTPRAARPVLRLRLDAGEQTYLLVVGPDADLEQLDESLQAVGARSLSMPEWLDGSAAEALEAVDQRIADLDRDIERTHGAIGELGGRHDVADALGQVRRLDWMVEHLPAVQVSEYLARITGWTDTEDAGVLTRPLEQAGIPAVIGFPEPPADREPPRLTHNPVWARPFELFMRLMGTPGRYETDPSRMLAFIAPVLFGYMFGDIGQGAVLMAAGFLLRRQWPVLTMLIPGGAMAMVFGLVFGSIFTYEGVIGPLWVNPIEEPLPVLVVPLIGGALLILLGLLLNGVAAGRQGHLGIWLRSDAGVVLAYVGALSAAWRPEQGLAAMALGIVWYLAGCAWEGYRSDIASALGHMGELLERLLQLAVNTLSFLRVGAFALAHAGLSVAVVSLGEGADNIVAEVIVLIVGNAVILVLEGLVVSVQTTRLILFEFFVRFFRAEGRPFRPMAPPGAG